METSTLFLIPFEVRQIIYEYYLSFTDYDYVWFRRSRLCHMYFIDDQPHSTALPSLMLTCKRAYAELRSDVHSTVYFRSFCCDTGIGVAVHGILRLERLHRLFLVINENYDWVRLLRSFGDLIDRMSALEHVTIDWKHWPLKESVESSLFEMLESMTSLRTVRIYGQVPGYRVREDLEVTQPLLRFDA
ncbi:hypothetical protein F4801DRAFT_588348 [Xylaria longipes]|nr:hypothetical protein F4801DRAFT_588348 [Xylaria longipes]